MTQHINALTILVAAAEKYVAGLDDLASQLVGEQVRLSKQVLEQGIHEMHSLFNQVQGLQVQLEEAQQNDSEIPVFEEVQE